MDKAQLEKTLKFVKDNSSKRNFNQSIDLIINLKDIDLKKQDNRVDIFAQLHFERGKKVKLCGLVGPELLEQAKATFDTVISVDDFSDYTDKKKIKKLAIEHVFFVAQANIMPKVATAFGRVLGPRGKMPNPKVGCVVPPNANLQPLAEKLQKTVKIKVETNLIFQTFVGKEDMQDNEIIDNILTIYNALIHALPNDKHNIKNAYLKLTMGKAYKIGAEEETAQQVKKKPEETEAKKEVAKEEKGVKKEIPKKEENKKEEKSPEK